MFLGLLDGRHNEQEFRVLAISLSQVWVGLLVPSGCPKWFQNLTSFSTIYGDIPDFYPWFVFLVANCPSFSSYVLWTLVHLAQLASIDPFTVYGRLCLLLSSEKRQIIVCNYGL